MLKKIPNILTIGRIIIVPFFVLAFYLPGFYGDLTALVLFIIASFTDFLDGMLARMLGEESKLGELLDPIADKIIIAAAEIPLAINSIIDLMPFNVNCCASDKIVFPKSALCLSKNQLYGCLK